MDVELSNIRIEIEDYSFGWHSVFNKLNEILATEDMKLEQNVSC